MFNGFLLPSTRVKNSPAIVLLLLANSVSGIAQGISMIAIPWYFSSGGMSAQFSWIYFSVTLISLFWGIYAGALVDRHSRRNLFLAINLAGLLLIGGITGWGFWANELPWFLVGLAFATTALIYNIHFPNLYAFAQEVTEPSDYGRVTSLLEVQGQITFALAGGFSALLLEGVQAGKGLMVYLPLPSHWAMRPWTIWEIFALDASTYLIALMLISRIRSLPSHSGKSDTAALSERIKLGFRFLKNHPVVLQFGLLSQTVFLSILINSLQLMPLYIFRFMGKGAEVYALSDMVFSLGALLAGMLAAQRFRISSVTLSIPLYTAAAGLCYLALLIKLPLSLFFCFHFLLGYFNAAVRVERVTFLFHQIPNHVIGRANSIFFVINVSQRLLFIGLFSLPFFLSADGVRAAVGVLALLCLITTLWLWRLGPAILQQIKKTPVA